jgi:hypothetical protein
MKTVWMMSSAAAVAAVVATVWGAQPARSSQDWLAKAQSEFATKARNAVIQRQIGKDVGGPESQVAVAVADLPAPVAAKSVPTLPTPIVQASAAPQAIELSKDIVVASAAADDVTTPPPSFSSSIHDEASIPAPVPPHIRDLATIKPADPAAAQPVVPALPQPAAEATSVATAAPAAKSAARPSVAESAPQKARRVAKSVASSHTSRRSASGSSMEMRGLDALRRHAPEIAAMVRSYM